MSFMTPCDWCGGPRLNGMIVMKDGDSFIPCPYSYNPAADNQRSLCRSCAKEALGIE